MRNSTQPGKNSVFLLSKTGMDSVNFLTFCALDSLILWKWENNDTGRHLLSDSIDWERGGHGEEVK